MALTATATERLRKTASSIIGLKDEVVMAKSPCKNHIMYAVLECAEIEIVFLPIAKGLYQERSLYLPPHLLQVIHRLLKYLFFFFKISWEGPHKPPSAPDIPEFRLVGMYMSCRNLK